MDLGRHQHTRLSLICRMRDPRLSKVYSFTQESHSKPMAEL